MAIVEDVDSVRRVREMPARNECRPRAVRRQQAGRLARLGNASRRRDAQQRTCLDSIGRDDGGERQQLVAERVESIRVQETRARACMQYRVEHDERWTIRA
jgi:hypothetical protein